MSVTIVEVLRRADQGITRPFLCRGQDDALYYVKGRGAGLRSMCCEWVAGRLAQEMELPVPPFTIAEVPTNLVEGSDREDIRDLGAGPVFASSRVEGVGEITWSEAETLPVWQMARVLLFDWWVNNDDRSLSALGGNPNLLMGTEATGPRKLWVFDFNLAFDEHFDPARFWQNHLFTALLPDWPQAWRAEIEAAMQLALSKVPEIFRDLPNEWLHIDGDENLPVQLDQDLVIKTLSRFQTDPDAFWSRP